MTEITKLAIKNFMLHRYIAVTDAFTPASAATDIASFSLLSQSKRRVARVKRIVVTGTATAAEPYTIFAYRSQDRNDYTKTLATAAAFSLQSAFQVIDSPEGGLYTVTANPGTLTGSRIRVGRETVMLGDATHAPVPAVFDFGPDGIAIKDFTNWIVLNAAGATLPAGISLTISAEWEEEVVPRIVFVGDSTTSEATQAMATLTNAGDFANQWDIRNHGNNGATVENVLNNTGGVIFPASATVSAAPDIIVMSLGINNIRTGAQTAAQLTTSLQALIEYFRTNLPDCLIVLREPNSITADGSTYVTLTGLFSAMTRAEAGQAATDILHDAYISFIGNEDVSEVVQTQIASAFGRTSLPLAEMPLMTDELHPNARGRMVWARLVLPVIIDLLPSIPAQQ